MTEFRGSAVNPSGLSGRTQCGLEELEKVALMGNSCWASFQNKKDLDEQRFIGFSFSGFGNFPKHGEKTRSKLFFSGHKLYLSKEGS